MTMYNLDLMIRNINKIDRLLKESFDEVQISENSSKNNFYFDVLAKKVVKAEGGGKKNWILKSKILKNTINEQNISWMYAINPSDEKLGWVERTSDIEDFPGDLVDIIAKGKLDESYINSIKEYHEDQPEPQVEENSLLKKISTTISEAIEVQFVESQKKVHSDMGENSNPNLTSIHFVANETIPVSKAILLESKLKTFEGVCDVHLSGKKISVQVDI